MYVGESLTDRERDAFQGHLTSAFVICQRRRQVKAGEERGVDDLTKLPRDELLHNFLNFENRIYFVQLSVFNLTFPLITLTPKVV